jgi:hypothetical protein
MEGLDRVRSMRKQLVGAAVVMIAVTGALTACTSDSPEPTPTGAATAGSDAEVIEPVDAIDGATATELYGISIDVPEGFEVEEQEIESGGTQLVLSRPGEERAEVYLTVTEQDDVTDDAVAAASAVTGASLGTSLEDMTTTPATWAGFGSAVVIRGTLPLDTGNRDIVSVTTRDPDGTRLVAVAAEAPEGDLDDSVAYEVLRSVKVAG